MNIRETFTYFEMTPALTAIGGNTVTQVATEVDRQGYDSLTVLVNFTQCSAIALANGTSYWFVRVQHADASAAGTADTFTDCASIDLIRPLSGLVAPGAVTSGIALYLNASTMSGTVQKIGYRGNKQFVRVALSHATMTMGASNVIDAIYMLGHAENWPVTAPYLDA